MPLINILVNMNTSINLLLHNLSVARRNYTEIWLKAIRVYSQVQDKPTKHFILMPFSSPNIWWDNKSYAVVP